MPAAVDRCERKRATESRCGEVALMSFSRRKKRKKREREREKKEETKGIESERLLKSRAESKRRRYADIETP